MASEYVFETRDQRIERMKRDNPGRPIELCTAVVDGMWDKKRELVTGRIPERFRDAEMVDLGYLSEKVVKALEKMFEDPSQNDTVGIILCGPVGSGKTHAMYAAVKWMVERNPEMVAYMASYPQAIQALRTEFFGNTYEELGSVWDRLNNESGLYDGVIVLDDVDSQKQTDFEVDKLTAFLDKRMNNFMPFILTTNVKPEDFKKVFGERLASRFMGYCEIVEFKERDKRVEPHGE